MEGHHADCNYYVLDFARLFPPEAPQAHLMASEPKGFLYRMLRPELVLSNAVALSSDAFTRWSDSDPQRKKYVIRVSCLLFLRVFSLCLYVLRTISHIVISVLQLEYRRQKCHQPIVQYHHTRVRRPVELGPSDVITTNH